MRAPAKHASNQRGVILFISLIVLVAMSLAGAALMRSVGVGGLVAGNVSFKRSTTSAGDFGLESGRQWLLTNANALLVNNAAATASAGYFASWDAAFNPNSFGWGGVASTDPQGNEVRFVIHRLCDPVLIGLVPDATRCATASGLNAGSTMRAVHVKDTALAGGSAVYYRITARVVGPKGTTSFVQALVLI